AGTNCGSGCTPLSTRPTWKRCASASTGCWSDCRAAESAADQAGGGLAVALHRVDADQAEEDRVVLDRGAHRDSTVVDHDPAVHARPVQVLLGTVASGSRGEATGQARRTGPNPGA